METSLVTYIATARAKGLTDEEIMKGLVQTGIPEVEVRRQLDTLPRHQSMDPPMIAGSRPVPPPPPSPTQTTQSSPQKSESLPSGAISRTERWRFGFAHLVLYLALSSLVGSGIGMASRLIHIRYPAPVSPTDQLSAYAALYVGSYEQTLQRWYIGAVVAALPVFVLAYLYIVMALRRYPGLQHMRARLLFTYSAMAIALLTTLTTIARAVSSYLEKPLETADAFVLALTFAINILVFVFSYLSIRE